MLWVLSSSTADFLGDDVRIKFVFDTEDYDDTFKNESSHNKFPFDTDLRNIVIPTENGQVYENSGRALDTDVLERTNLLKVSSLQVNSIECYCN